MISLVWKSGTIMRVRRPEKIVTPYLGWYVRDRRDVARVMINSQLKKSLVNGPENKTVSGEPVQSEVS